MLSDYVQIGSRALIGFIRCPLQVLGTSIWHSFINGPVAYKHLPRQQFGNLQSQLFPYYFSIQTGGSALLAWLWSRSSSFGRALDRKLISVMFAGGALNLILVGPWTTSIMRRRHRQERIEGTTYDQTDRPVSFLLVVSRQARADSLNPQHSDKMKALNKKFALAHSVSALLNLGFVGASVALSLLVGEFGLSA